MRASEISKWIDNNCSKASSPTPKRPSHRSLSENDSGDATLEHHLESSHTLPPPEQGDHNKNTRSKRRPPKRSVPRNTPTPKKNSLQGCGNNSSSPVPPPHKRGRYDSSLSSMNVGDSAERQDSVANPVAAEPFCCPTCSTLLPRNFVGNVNDYKNGAGFDKPSPHKCHPPRTPEYPTNQASSPSPSPSTKKSNMGAAKGNKDTKRPTDVSTCGSTATPPTKRSRKSDSSGSDVSSSSNNSKLSAMVKRDWMANGSYPALSFSQDSKDDLPIPDYVTSIILQFCENELASGCVPSDLKKELVAHFLAESFIDRNFSSDFGDSKHILKTVVDIVKESAWLNTTNQDEAKWTKLVSQLLEYSTKQLSFDEQRHQPIVAQDVTLETLHDKEFFPGIGLKSKLDYILLLNHKVEPFKSLLSKAIKSGILLNPFTHTHTAKTIVVLGVEIKSPLGDSLAPAELQVGIWSAKTGCTYNMFNNYGKVVAIGTDREENGASPVGLQSDFEEMKPIISITVLGPLWNLHISYRNQMGNYVILGPYPVGSTSTALGTFKILKCLNLIREYSVKEIWPWVAERLEAAIKRIKENPPRNLK